MNLAEYQKLMSSRWGRRAKPSDGVGVARVGAGRTKRFRGVDSSCARAVAPRRLTPADTKLS